MRCDQWSTPGHEPRTGIAEWYSVRGNPVFRLPVAIPRDRRANGVKLIYPTICWIKWQFYHDDTTTTTATTGKQRMTG